MRKILVIEDNIDVAELLSLHLKDQGYLVDTLRDGAQGLSHALKSEHDLLILDVMLPDISGLDICRKLRSKENYLPILMLTAKSTEFDRVLGLEIGGDDYITKPFSIRELLARVNALLRRVEVLKNSAKTSSQDLKYGDLFISINKREVSRKGQLIHLTAREFELLTHLAKSPGQVYTRTQLLEEVWGYGHEGYDHTVNTHMNRLRTKIEDNPSKPKFITTVWGVGYKFCEQ